MAVKIFFCYAHEDEALLNKLKSHLKPLQLEGLIEGWHDRDISAGMAWQREISNHLNEAQIILLLISPDFMGSDYCNSIEMKRALERYERDEARVIPIILRHVYWQWGPLGVLQALPTDGKPVTDQDGYNQDRAFYDITKGIHKVVEQLSLFQVIAALKTDIARGTFESETPLKEIPLAEQYKVTPEAIHDALLVLEAGGFIQHLADKGYVSYGVTSLQEAEDIYQTREVLEGLASRLFSQRATPDRVIELENAIDAFAEAARHPEQKDALLSAKNQVYEVLFQGCNNKVLYALLQSLRDRISYLRKQTLSRPGRPEQTLKELRAILDAIKKGKNPEKASIIHVRNAANVAYDKLRNRNMRV